MTLDSKGIFPGAAMTDSLRLLRGTLNVLILRTLEAGPRHGYDIVSAIAHLSDGALRVEDGALYQSLHRMRERGWVRSEWGTATAENARVSTS